MAGDVTLGFYSMAKQLALLPVEKVSVVVNQVTIPVMAELQTDSTAMRDAFLRGIRLVLYITIPVCLGMALVAEDLIWVTLTDKWMSAVPLLQVLCFYALIRSGDVLLPPIFMARSRITFLFWYAMVLLAIMPVAFWAGAASMGALGVALIWVTVYPVIMVWMARVALRELKIYWKTIWDQLWPAMLVTLFMAGVILAVRWAIPGFDFMDRVIRLILTIGTGSLAYGLGILWKGGAVVEEFREGAGLLIRSIRLVFVGK
jgi:O-antigen/teichoic acid export membrane protein